ncbi:YihY/virulence factor BrkB family protein [Acidipropionibacterium jensenii]|uniref:YihY/virulence factor BrkB family protein n=1 Tax=Acidipropionibacterium jensenii TaxID=1749 RepID=UPI00214CBED8|nr:YihY/virulence factor BrkB family protein [Acidipropionibacterium jensenii]
MTEHDRHEPDHSDQPAHDDLAGRPALPADTGLAPPAAPPLKEALRAPGVKGRVTGLATWWKSTRLARALSRYGNANGGLLASGMALTTMLSLTAVLTVAITTFMAVLGRDDELRASFLNALNSALPGILKTSDNPGGLVSPDALIQSNTSSLTGIIALVIAAYSAISLLNSLTTSIQTMFGLVALPGNAVMKYVRSALGLLGLGIGLLATSGLGILVNVFGSWLNRALGLSPGVGRVSLLVGTQLVSLVIDAALVLMLVRFVARVRVPRRDLLWGLAMFAIASAVLRELGTTAVGSVNGAVLASATAVLTLILWINLGVRVLLLVCAWMANPPQPISVSDAAEVHFDRSPNFVTMSSPETLEWPHHAVTGEVQPVPDSPGVISKAQDPLPEKD